MSVGMARLPKNKQSRRLRLAVLISGGGTTLQNLIDRVRDGRLPGVEIAIVIASRPGIQGIQRAHAAGLPVDVIPVKEFPDVDRFSDHLILTLDAFAVDLVVQAGWLCFWKLPGRWLGKVINIHPALLPKFGGKGYYGRHVHEAVLAAGELHSGATVHWVDNEYDHGKIIMQKECAVLPGDTPEALAERVQAIERELLPAAIQQIQNR
jgi:phosphoribosylglycinamide formyltransferase-1